MRFFLGVTTWKLKPLPRRGTRSAKSDIYIYRRLRLAERCGEVRTRTLSAGLLREFTLCPHPCPCARFASSPRGESLSARWLRPPPARPLRRRRRSPAPGRSQPPPRPRCRQGSTFEPPRGTCRSRGLTPTLGPPHCLPCSPSGTG